MKVKRIILIFLIILISIKNIVYGKHVTDLDIKLTIPWAGIQTGGVSFTDEELNELFTSNTQNEKVINDLKIAMGYSSEENSLKEKMKFDTTFQIVSSRKKYYFLGETVYKIQVGNICRGMQTTIGGIKKKDLTEIYGCPDVKKENEPWNVVLITTCKPREGKESGGPSYIMYDFKINEIYNDYETDNYVEGLKATIADNQEISTDPTLADIVSGYHQVNNAIEKYTEWKDKFGKDPGGTIAKAVIDFFKFIADIIQTILNKIQTLIDGIPANDFSITYKKNELENNSDNSDTSNSSSTDNGDNSTAQVSNSNTDKVNYKILDKYTKVGKHIENTEDDKKTITIDNKIDKFTKNTEIPVIPIDIYGVSFEKIDFFSVDFLNINKKENKSSIWNSLREIFSTITHVVLYLSTAVILSSLIYHGINIIKSRNDNPANRVTHIEGLNRFIISLTILVVVIFLMALCTTLSNYLMSIIKGNNSALDDSFPITVNVNKVYSFKTNITGYFRFMAESEDLSRRATYTIEYIVMVMINVFISFLMIYRMIKMWILGMIGPSIAAVNALNAQEKIRFKLTLKDWAKSYIKLASIQIIILLFYMLIEYAMVTKG